MIQRAYDWTMRMAAHRKAPQALFWVSFAESSFFPIPPDAMLIPMVLANRSRAWFYAGLATVASGVLAHATAKTLMDQDERKAALYDITAKKLRRLIDRDLDKVKAAVARGDESALERFFADARSIMEQEHAVWSYVGPADED